MDGNQEALGHSCLSRPSNASTKASSLGFPGRERSSSTSFG